MARGAVAVLGLAFVSSMLAGCIGSGGDEELGASSLAPAFSETAVYPGEYKFDKDWSQVVTPGSLAILAPEVSDLESTVDGALVQVGVVRPDVAESERVPVVVYASPYIFGGMSPTTLVDEYMYATLAENFVPHGYAVAFVPIRGTANNGGCMDLMGPAERADLDLAITWLGEQPWSNGNVAIVGLSYDGSTPWEVASMGNPYLKTIVPMSGVNDIFGLMFNNGTTEFRGPVVLNALYYTFGFLEYNAVQNGRSPQHMVEGIVCPESLEGIAISAHSGVTGEVDPIGFWAARNSRPGVEENYRGSIFIVQGLQDWNVDPHIVYPWVNKLEEKGIVVKHLLGQWDHSFPDTNTGSLEHAQRWDWAEMLLHWFDHELKGDASADPGPRVQVEDSAHQWRIEQDWPPKDAVATTLYLAPGGALATEPAAGSESVALVGPGWAFTDQVTGPLPCVGCPTFTSAAFDVETRFAGVPKLHVTVTPTAPTAEVAASLYVVDGSERLLVGWGAMDIRFAEGGSEPIIVTPGEPLLLKMVLEPLDVVIPAGAALELTLHERGYGDHTPGLPLAPMTVEAGGEQSTLTIHTFTRGPEVFFEPPAK